MTIHQPSPSRYKHDINAALNTAGGHLSIGRGGFTLHYGNSARLSGYDIEPIKAECIAAGLPVIDSLAAPFDAVAELAIRGPMIAVGRDPDPKPLHSLSFASLQAIARNYAEAGAEVWNVPGIQPPGDRRSEEPGS
ncbi:hypothetical protein [Chelativorans sp. AA-79]|uniref:hypothetical protein n=1 Tax=Chelativorans sp. AA-79 TaxID=3028735 RepID=UPI0023F77307|nr:hypothetical protein [Chelativorans sp. AA-79]WEX12380.1 hypothetical protein PVE73_27190 [Chelativorans sp. AA-79]